MERKTFLIAVLAIPFFISDEKGDPNLKPDFKGGKIPRPSRENPPTESSIKELYQFKPSDFAPGIHPKKIPKLRENYNPQPFQYFGTEPIEDIDYLAYIRKTDIGQG